MRKKVSFERLVGIQPRPSGLNSREVAQQRSRYGANTIVERMENPWLAILKDTGKDPMIWFLVGVGGAFALVGNHQEAVTLFLAILPLLFMDAFLHWRTQASTISLKGQLATEALVIREDRRILIDSREIVPGDLIVLSSDNASLPADGYWETAESVQADESVLTGEVFPIAKRPLQFKSFHGLSEVPIDVDSLGFCGTRVLTGNGVLRALSTGRNTEYGEIVQSVSTIAHERTALQISIAKLTKVLIFAAFGFCLLLAAIRYQQGHGLFDALLSAATLAVAAIPEEFPVVFTFFLGVGVYRLAKRKALVRRAVSVENLGRVTRICTDKTGTMTQGLLKLTHIDSVKDSHLQETLLYAAVASNLEGTDPVDQAILEEAKRREMKIPLRVKVTPYTEDRKRESAFFQDGGRFICAIKGSPEMVLSMSTLPAIERMQWLEKTANWAAEGHKMLAVGFRKMGEDLNRMTEPGTDFEFAGLLAFEDPPRPEVRKSIEYCERNGIKVLMITGDHPQTAAAIAKDVGMGRGSLVVVTAESEPEKFEEMWLKTHPEFLDNADVVARCNPIQKLRIVASLKSHGDIVAVTGDGVNDVPALKVADIGIAMGIRGARSAKEVSSIILADDNFSTIVNAIREGKQLFSNLQRSFEYLLLFHIPFVLSAALIPLIGYPLIYLPIHVVWLELIIHPTALFAFQQYATINIDANPNKRNSFFTKKDALRIVLIGILVTGAVMHAYVSGLSNGGANYGRAEVLALLAFWSGGLAYYLTKGESFIAIVIAIASIGTAVGIIQISHIAEIFHLTPLNWSDWIKGIGVSLGSILLLHFSKRLLGKFGVKDI